MGRPFELIEVKKRTVKFEYDALYITSKQDEQGREMVYIHEADDDEEYIVMMRRETFLDAVVALWPENVAYQFPDEKDDDA